MRLALAIAFALTCGCAAGQAPRSEPACPAVPTVPSAAPSSGGTPAIPYDLPKSGEFLPPPPDLPGGSPQASVHSILTVDIDKAGALTVNGKAVANLDEVTRIARESLANDPEIRAIIRADAGVAWGVVIVALDRLKQGGIAKVAFGVSPLPGP